VLVIHKSQVFKSSHILSLSDNALTKLDMLEDNLDSRFKMAS